MVFLLAEAGGVGEGARDREDGGAVRGHFGPPAAFTPRHQAQPISLSPSFALCELSSLFLLLRSLRSKVMVLGSCPQTVVLKRKSLR